MTAKKKTELGILHRLTTADIAKAGTFVTVIGGALLTVFHVWGQSNNDTRAKETTASIDTVVKAQYQKRHFTDSVLEAHRWDSIFHLINPE